LKLGKLCDCGHLEKTYSIKTIDGSTYCHSCWKLYQEKAGLVDSGCVFPEAKVCTDREPAILQKNKMIMEEIKCYRGHNYCIKYEAENILSIISHSQEEQPVTCPRCNNL